MIRIKSRRSIYLTLAIQGLYYATASALEEPEPMIPIYKDPPSYPRVAIEQKIQGWVYTEFTVNKNGTVDRDSIVILDEEPAGVFSQPALKSAQSLRFDPKLDQNGEAISAKGVTYLFQFSLGPGKDGSHFPDTYTGREPPAEYY